MVCVLLGVIPYCIVIVGSGPPPGPWEEKLKQFVRQFEADGDQLGCRIRMNKTPLTSSPSSVAEKFKMINDALGKAEVSYALGLPLEQFMNKHNIIVMDPRIIERETTCLLYQT